MVEHISFVTKKNLVGSNRKNESQSSKAQFRVKTVLITSRWRDEDLFVRLKLLIISNRFFRGAIPHPFNPDLISRISWVGLVRKIKTAKTCWFDRSNFTPHLCFPASIITLCLLTSRRLDFIESSFESLTTWAHTHTLKPNVHQCHNRPVIVLKYDFKSKAKSAKCD